MLHPLTELKFVSQDIGYGVFATSFIPIGTITWVKDDLDRVIPKEDLPLYSAPNLENLMKYTYRNSDGNFVFCWDLTRYVNHSFFPNSMLTGLGFEIAIRDILPGDELTNDYGTLNILESFQCATHPDHLRQFVYPDDLARYFEKWDAEIKSAFLTIQTVQQPLEKFLTESQKEELTLIHSKKREIPSVLNNLCRS